jgi:Predicted membrane protein
MMNTVLDLLLLNMLTLISAVKDGLGYSAQKACSAGIAIIFSYILNKYWSFKSSQAGNNYIEFGKFFAISIFSMAIQVIVATIMVSFVRPLFDISGPFLTNAQLWVNIGGISGSLFGAISNFLGYKFYVFERNSHPPRKKVSDATGTI